MRAGKRKRRRFHRFHRFACGEVQEHRFQPVSWKFRESPGLSYLYGSIIKTPSQAEAYATLHSVVAQVSTCELENGESPGLSYLYGNIIKLYDLRRLKPALLCTLL